MHFKVVTDIRVPDITQLKNSGNVVYRHFYKGTQVTGTPTSNCETCVKGSNALLVENSFMIPMEHLKELTKKEANKFSGIDAGKSSYDIYKKGMFAGVVVGTLAFIKMKKHFIWLTVGGAIAGGYIAQQLKEKQDKTNTQL